MVQETERTNITEKIHNLCTALNVIEKGRLSKNTIVLWTLRPSRNGKVSVKMPRYYFSPETGPGTLSLVWKNKQDEFIDG